MPDISVELSGVKFRNPVFLTSGILGVSINCLKRVAENGAGAVTMKSIGPTPRDGHNNPTVLVYKTGVMNAVGLPSCGYKKEQEELKRIKEIGVPAIISVYGGSAEEYAEVAENVSAFKPAFIELNMSCPNTKSHGAIFGVDENQSRELVGKVKDRIGKTPLIAKLTPRALDIGAIAKACEEAGANAISAINTVGPGMVINIETKKPVFAFKTAGLSGPPIRPITIKCVYEIYEQVKIPIIAIGGITYGRDAIEAMQAGAKAVEVGSAIYYRGMDVFKKICSEMTEWMEKNGYSNLKQLVGVAHE